MKTLRSVVSLAVVLLLAAGLGGCNRQKVVVRDGEVVMCTYGEIVSDTTEELEVSPNKVGDYGVKTRTVTCDLHTKLAALYAGAQQAIADGDTEAARKALAEVLALDPSYGNARTQLDAIEAGKKAVADNSAPSGSSGNAPGDTEQNETPGEEVPTGPAMSLMSFMPDRVSGFVGQLPIVDAFVLTRDYLPVTPGPITKLVAVAEQFKNEEMAQERLEQSIKTSYPMGAADIRLGGRDAYFGAKGSVSAIAFVEGSILVVIEAGSTEGDGTSFKTTLLNVADEMVP